MLIWRTEFGAYKVVWAVQCSRHRQMRCTRQTVEKLLHKLWPHATPCSSASRRNVHTSCAADMQGYISSAAVIPSVSMNLSSSEVQMLETYRASLEHWGWRWKVCGPHAESVLLTHFGSVLNNSMNAVDMQVCVVLLCFMVFAAWVCYSDSCSLLPAVFLFLSAELCCCLICLPTRVFVCGFALRHCLNVLQC